ncbi:FAD synthetase family protein [candidate division KSB1 bacterium]|nr:FAD synthetase family protein [candidate division KSB1 bacterium]
MYVARHHVHWHEIQRSVVTIGTFDGVHLGHRAIISALLDLSKSEQLYPLVVSFQPHPRTVISNGTELRLIQSVADRLRAFARIDAPTVCLRAFTRELAAMSPAEFVTDVLQREFHAKALVMGFDHAFGRDRAGTRDVASALGAGAGFTVRVVPPVMLGGEIVCSTAIRAKLRAGDVAAAAAMLGRPFETTLRQWRHWAVDAVTGLAQLTADWPTDRVVIGDGVYAGYLQSEPILPVGILIQSHLVPSPGNPAVTIMALGDAPQEPSSRARLQFVERVGDLDGARSTHAQAVLTTELRGRITEALRLDRSRRADLR